MVKRRPITPGEAWTSRTRKTISTAAATPLNRLEVAVVAAIARKERVAEDEAQAFGDAVHEPGVPALRHGGPWLGCANGAQGDGGDDEAHRVDRHRGGAPDGLDEATGDARAGHRRHLRAAGELGVALHQVLPTDQGGKVRLVGDVEEDREDPGGQRHDEELGERQTADGVGDRNRAQREHPSQVGPDHGRGAAHAVDPHAGREPDDEKGRRRRRGEEPHLEGRGVECPHRQQGDGEQADLRAELADGLTAPEQPEVAVAPEGTLGHRRTLMAAQ